MEEDKREKKVLPLFRSLIIRIAVGAYLLYTVYSLRNSPNESEGGQLIFFIAAMVIFGAIGIFLLAHSAYALIKGNYIKSSELEMAQSSDRGNRAEETEGTQSLTDKDERTEEGEERHE